MGHESGSNGGPVEIIADDIKNRGLPKIKPYKSKLYMYIYMRKYARLLNLYEVHGIFVRRAESLRGAYFFIV